MGRYNHSLSLDASIMVSKNCPIIGEHFVITFVTEYVTIATVLLAKTTLDYSFKSLLCKGSLKTARLIFCVCYQHLISMARRNFWQSLKKFL